MTGFQINKILGLVLGTLLFLQAVHIVDGMFTPAKGAKSGSEVAVKEEQPAAAVEVPIENSARQRLGRQGRPNRQAVRHLPQLPGRPGPQSRSRSLWHRRPRRGSRAGLQLFGSIEGQGRHLDIRCTEQVADQTQCRRAGHGDDLRRPVERETARRRHRLPQHPLGKATAVADGTGCAGCERTGGGSASRSSGQSTRLGSGSRRPRRCGSGPTLTSLLPALHCRRPVARGWEAYFVAVHPCRWCRS